MATLHMDTDVAHGTSNTIRNTYNEMTSQLNAVSSSCDNLAGAWQGQSATQFKSEYDDWRSKLSQALEALNTLQQRLDKEITEWETAAQSLS